MDAELYALIEEVAELYRPDEGVVSLDEDEQRRWTTMTNGPPSTPPSRETLFAWQYDDFSTRSLESQLVTGVQSFKPLPSTQEASGLTMDSPLAPATRLAHNQGSSATAAPKENKSSNAASPAGICKGEILASEVRTSTPRRPHSPMRGPRVRGPCPYRIQRQRPYRTVAEMLASIEELLPAPSIPLTPKTTSLSASGIMVDSFKGYPDKLPFPYPINKEHLAVLRKQHPGAAAEVADADDEDEPDEFEF